MTNIFSIFALSILWTSYQHLTNLNMNLRDIKKDIEYLIGEFIDDCSLFITLNPKKGTEKVSPIVDEAVDLYNDLKYKINHPAEGARKAYYDNLRREMLERLDALSEKLSAVISTEE